MIFEVFLITLLFGKFSNEQIPPEYQRVLKHAKSFEGLLNNLHVIYSPYLTNRQIDKTSGHGVTLPLKTGSASQRILSLQNIKDYQMDGFWVCACAETYNK
uniref:Uncharacterized protein n=1 Tax=Caenorhabditis japonica TaxID=281687 RepID=A0A8R1DF87_CAEJA